MKKILLIAMALMISISAAACERKEVKAPVKVSTKQTVVVKPTLESLDRRVSDIEDRMARARAARGKLTPAPKYDPNFVK